MKYIRRNLVCQLSPQVHPLANLKAKEAWKDFGKKKMSDRFSSANKTFKGIPFQQFLQTKFCKKNIGGHCFSLNLKLIYEAKIHICIFIEAEMFKELFYFWPKYNE